MPVDAQLIDCIMEWRDAGPEGRKPLFSAEQKVPGRHQFLFFMKPELVRRVQGLRFDEICNLIIRQFDSFGLRVEQVIGLSGSYLGAHRIMSEHYGVIDAVARDPLGAMSEQSSESFQEIYGKRIDEVRMVGGFEYLRLHPELDEESLSSAWLAGDFKKLGGGTYSESLPDEKLYLINGFYPRLLAHFTRKESAILSFVVSGDLSWRVARREFIGATDPHKAERDSLRAMFLKEKDDLGIAEISANLNGVHLSAGPVEALVELLRFTTAAEKSTEGLNIGSFSFGKLVEERFSPSQVRAILGNVTVKHEGMRVSVFDLTEEADADAALDLLESVRLQLA